LAQQEPDIDSSTSSLDTECSGGA